MIIQIGLGLNFMAPTPLFIPIMDEYSISKASVSFLISTVLFVLTVSLLPGGLLVAKLGSKKAITLCGLFMSAGLLTPLTSSFAHLVILRLLFGIGAAISLSATSTLIMEWFKPREFSFLNGLNEAGRAIGVSLGLALAVPGSNLLGWKFTFFSFGVVSVIGTVCWFVAGRTPVNSKHLEPSVSLKDNIPFILNRNTLLLAIGLVGPFSVFIGYSAWLPSYYNEVQGMTMEKAGSMLAILPLMAGIANPLSGLFQTKFGKRKPVLKVVGLLLPLFALGTILFSNTFLIGICLIGLGALFSLFIVAALTIAMELPNVTPSRVAIVTAAILTIGNAAAALSPIFIGSLTDYLGIYQPAMVIISLMPLTLTIPGIFLPETGPKGVLQQPLKP